MNNDNNIIIIIERGGGIKRVIHNLHIVIDLAIEAKHSIAITFNLNCTVFKHLFWQLS